MNVNGLLHILVIGILIRIAYIDAKTMEIPDKYQVFLGICGLLSTVVVGETSLIERMIGMFCISVPMFLLCILIPDAFGGGDIKLICVMGFYLGCKILLSGVFFGVLFGGIQAMYLLFRRKVYGCRQTHMAFGPALCTGFIVSMTFGDRLLFWYFHLFY